MATVKEVPAVGVEVAGITEKEPGPASLAGVVVVVAGTDVVVVDVVVDEVVVTVPVVVVVGTMVEAPTVIGAETPSMPEMLSVTSSTVVPGSTRVTMTVATPPVKLTVLPAVQAPWAG